MNKASLTLTLLLACYPVAHAAATATPPTAAPVATPPAQKVGKKTAVAAETSKKPSTLAEAVQQYGGQTDIIAPADTPMVTNILPWQEQEAKIPKEFSALRDALVPTDRDRLVSEIRYTQILNQSSDNQK